MDALNRRAVLGWIAAAPLAAPDRSAAATELVLSEDGDLPLLLSAPHGGTEAIPGVPPRTTGTTVRDAGTSELVAGLADQLQQRLGRRPYLVVARFSRRHLDANRPESQAMESAAAAPVYRAYHGRIGADVAALSARYPRGALLIDVHAQGQQPDTIFRGTRGGLTVRRLLERHGTEALCGPHSLIGELAARGYRVDPAVDDRSMREDPRFVGGHTVATYGSHRAEGIDAIQLEFGAGPRADARLPAHLADALAAFMGRYGLLGA